MTLIGNFSSVEPLYRYLTVYFNYVHVCF